VTCVTAAEQASRRPSRPWPARCLPRRQEAGLADHSQIPCGSAPTWVHLWFIAGLGATGMQPVPGTRLGERPPV